MALDFNMLLPSFVMFVRSKDPTELYRYSEPRACAFAQFLRSQGYRDASVGTQSASTNWHETREDDIVFPKPFARMLSSISNDTFGELSKELDIYLEQHPINIVAGEL